MNQAVHDALAAAAHGAAASPSLADELDALYRDTRAKMGEADLAHIRNVAAYSRAIDARARALITGSDSLESLRRGVLLRALHVVLEFSELGHNILHGSYDHLEALDPGGPFHSERWDWDFVTDPGEWKVMHHRNHHPFTNIVGKDHDLGFSIARLFPGQDWFGHHALQLGVLGLFVAHVYPFAIYTATSAARVDGRKVFSRDTFERAGRRIRDHVRRDYISEPRRAGRRALRALLGNHLGTLLGYDMLMVLLLIEHHSPNVEVFPDPGPRESRDAYFERQLRGTTNFQPIPSIEAALQRLLEEEVPFDDRPDFRVFYGGLDTHIEHHLFPDLPCNRQREVVGAVRDICARHGVPYNVQPMAELAPAFVRGLARNGLPLAEQERAPALLTRPRALARRLRDGVGYRKPRARYLRRPRTFNAEARVLRVQRRAAGEAISVTLERPDGWAHITWPPGAFVSLRVDVEGDALVRQYSLTRESDESPHMELTIKRVAGGRVSNHLADTLRPGHTLTLVGPPESTGGLAQRAVPDKALYLAGGVGITPILSMLRRHARVAPERDAVLLTFDRSPASSLFDAELAKLVQGTNIRVWRFVDGPDGVGPDGVGPDGVEPDGVEPDGVEPDGVEPDGVGGLVAGDRLSAAAARGRLSLELIREHVPDVAERQVFACAPEGMLDAACAHFDALGLPADQLHLERFVAPEVAQRALTGRTHTVRLLRSGVTLEVDESTTLLNAARAAGLDVPAGCERGLCRACVCSKRSGETLTGAALHEGVERVTLCNTFPRSAVELDV